MKDLQNILYLYSLIDTILAYMYIFIQFNIFHANNQFIEDCLGRISIFIYPLSVGKSNNSLYSIF